MHVKTMEGLVGARSNIDMVNVPMRVYKDARRRGDTATMERAMGYACEFAGRAGEYKAEADEGMKEDAKEAREKAKIEREKTIEKRREERIKMQGQTERNKDITGGTAEVSEEGKLLPEDTTQSGMAVSETAGVNSGKKPVIYTKTAEACEKEHGLNISVFV